jgi:ribosomal protein L40E
LVGIWQKDFFIKHRRNMEKPKILSEAKLAELSNVFPEGFTGWAYYFIRVGAMIAQAQLDADVAYYEPLIQQAKAEVARSLFDEIICPMCYRLNPHHANENNGKGCSTCQEKEGWCQNEQ